LGRTHNGYEYTLFFLPTRGQSALQDSIRNIAREAKGTVGVAYKMAGDPSYEGINTSAHLPMQSVFKFHLALYFLHLIDEKRLTRAIIVNSDNVACDILFRAACDTHTVQAYINSLGITDISIAATEAEMHHSWPVQYTNWTTPAAMLSLLEKFDAGKILSPNSTQLLVKWMSESPRIANRLKGLLPTGTPVAHKPGTSDVSPEGIAAATNDVGIIILPNKKHLLIAVFVSDAKAAETTREWVIARIAQLVYQANTTTP